jgi:hypothetical protein
MLAFAMAFHTGFGLQLYNYRDLGTTMMTLIRFALGDVDINEMLVAQPTLAVVLMVLFTFLIYLQLVGIAVAVLLRYYATQPSDERAVGRFITDFMERRDVILANALADLKAAKAALAQVLRLRSSVKPTNDESGTGQALQRERRARMQTAAHTKLGGSVGSWVAADDGAGTDAMTEAEAAFGLSAQTPEQRAIVETAKSTERLKALYLDLADGRQHTLGKLELVRTVVRAVRDENFALAAALRDRGVTLDAAIDVTGSFIASIEGKEPVERQDVPGAPAELAAKGGKGAVRRRESSLMRRAGLAHKRRAVDAGKMGAASTAAPPGTGGA